MKEIHPISDIGDLKKKPESIYYKRGLEIPTVELPLGKLCARNDIPSSIKGFHWYPEIKVEYPPSIIGELEEIYDRYNTVFTSIVSENQEWPNDYLYACNPQGGAINYFVQIDMTGLTPEFIERAKYMRPEELKPELKERIFEIENSLAMYNFMRGIFQRGDNSSFFRQRFDGALEDLRQRFGRPIALLAGTDQKYQSMLATEFGIVDPTPETEISGETVKELSGFDMFFGPKQFEEYLRQEGRCGYLLYTRTSLPVSVLRDPASRVQLTIPLLEDPKIRRIRKENSIMFNIDSPERYRETPLQPKGIINDTKMYMVYMGLAYPIYYLEDLFSEEFNSFLRAKGLQPSEAYLHAKPLVLSYGSYGHIKGPNNTKFRQELKRALKARGPYVVQPEITTPLIHNADAENNQELYHFIDRIFFYCDPDGKVHFLGGFRNLMPADIFRGEKLKVHGNKEAAWIEITD